MTKKEIKLEAETRIIEKEQVADLRRKGYLPVNLYGPGKKNQNLKIKKINFAKVYDLAGESNLVDLMVDNEKLGKILIKEVQVDSIKSDIMHADIYQVDMNKKISTEIPLNFIGEAKAVKDHNTFLVKNLDSLEIECLPSDLVNQIDVDTSRLLEIGDAIRVSDLKLPAGMELITDKNDIVVSVVEQKIEVEPVAVEPTVEETADGKKAEEAADGKKAEEKSQVKES